MNERPEPQEVPPERTSNLTYFNTQILSFQKEELDRYSRILGKSRAWIVREALHRFFNECREDGLRDEGEH